MIDNKNRFTIFDYQKQPTFSSFLPGIAGEKGIPVWVYYNNRGQGVCSFGVDDKEHPILEFCPAYTAYKNNDRTGFRTFLKVDGEYKEAFTGKSDMFISSGQLEISWSDDNIQTDVLYFGVPNHRVAALARVLTVKNTSDKAMTVEVLDGLPELVPYGVNNETLKMMTQLATAWMQVEDLDKGLPYFRVRASMADTACVTKVEGGNFVYGLDENGDAVPAIVDSKVIFGSDNAFVKADMFEKEGTDILNAAQVTQNKFPCCFLAKKKVLQPGEEMVIASVYGQAENKEEYHKFVSEIKNSDWFDENKKNANDIISNLTDAVFTRTKNPVFDEYCKQNYLDNLLRGGVPMFFKYEDKSTPFYMYSRKHGDPEREYNAFSLGREYYAQGNGNFRDVNQNRRSDIMFQPDLGDTIITSFFELIQSDGYNPLVITASTFKMDNAAAEELCSELPENIKNDVIAILTADFTPGKLAMHLENTDLTAQQQEVFLAKCICNAHSEPNANLAEGYWSDHWTYNIDLIERYLAVFPENKDKLLFGNRDLRWYETHAFVYPRCKRYVHTENGLRQYNSLDMERKAESSHKWMHTSNGEIAYSNLIEKILLLCTVKTATLDACGYGVEMEGGKPGWYDALNGLPGLFGSSVAESCELARWLGFARQALKEKTGSISVYKEIADLITNVYNDIKNNDDLFARWNAMNVTKESYRDNTAEGFCGESVSMECSELAEILNTFENTVLDGINRAVEVSGGICPTYFSFTAEDVEETNDGPMPKKLTPHVFPLFLEGPVHWLKLNKTMEEKGELAKRIKASGLYDKKLKMFKVNESLENVSFEAGRTKAFTPGWLENESIWLHMEYKYLLELLKSGLYDEFAEALHNAAIPFLDEKVYGRSLFENVSFIASSANPDESVHGRGFVARLSGSTAEFLDIWQRMFFGNMPFRKEDNGLVLNFEPFIPEYLMPEDGVVKATFANKTKVTYKVQGRKVLVPGEYRILSWDLTDKQGNNHRIVAPELPEEFALKVRKGEIQTIDIEIG